ncbi:MAG: hypothetical protein IJZ19_11025 [Lentisphaeria bacterium]|nr:hypothetical protein [Lentisphaeria bacterium]
MAPVLPTGCPRRNLLWGESRGVRPAPSGDGSNVAVTTRQRHLAARQAAHAAICAHAS